MSNTARTDLDAQEPQIDDALYTWDQDGPSGVEVYEITDPLVIAQDAPVLTAEGEPALVPDIAPDDPAPELDF